MADIDIRWPGPQVNQDSTHRMITDTQIAKWDGYFTVKSVTNWNSATDRGLYVDTSSATNKPTETTNVFFGEVYVNTDSTFCIQKIYSTTKDKDISIFYRRGWKSSGSWTFDSRWYKVKTNLYNPDELLQDFTYTIDSSTGVYTLDTWKQTYQGESSTKLIVPDTEIIQISI